MATLKVELEIFGDCDPDYGPDKIEEVLINKAVKALQEKTSPIIHQKIADAVMEIINKKLNTVIDNAIEKLLKDGIELFDEYGRVKGKKTLKDMIVESLNHRSQYESDTFLKRKLTSHVENALNRELKSELEDIRKQFRSAVEGKFTDVLIQQIKKEFKML